MAGPAGAFLSTGEIALLGGLFLVAAVLYSSVGHAGASGYLAAMALVGVAPAVMKPTALVLNIVVAVIATIQFARAGCFSWRLFWPFAATSIPFAFLGGSLTLPIPLYKPLVGVVLLFSAVRLFLSAHKLTAEGHRTLPVGIALVLGAALGLLSGVTGVGGGIFLSPLLLLMGWAGTRQTSGVSAAFILVNSVAGLLGHASSVRTIPSAVPVWGLCVLAGGWIGSEFGSRRFDPRTLRRLLSVVLVVAGLKMILT